MGVVLLLRPYGISILTNVCEIEVQQVRNLGESPDIKLSLVQTMLTLSLGDVREICEFLLGNCYNTIGLILKALPAFSWPRMSRVSQTNSLVAEYLLVFVLNIVITDVPKQSTGEEVVLGGAGKY